MEFRLLGPLFFALIYNAIGIPIAAGILYPLLGLRLSPILAAAAMTLSSLSVVGNANRLRRYHPTPLPRAQVIQVETGAQHHRDTERETVPTVRPGSTGH